jgi:hypothetical protein
MPVTVSHAVNPLTISQRLFCSTELVCRHASGKFEARTHACRSAGIAAGNVLGRMSLNISNVRAVSSTPPDPEHPSLHATCCQTPASKPHGQSAVALGPPLPGAAAGSTSAEAAAIADAVAEVYPVVQLLPLTRMVRCRLHTLSLLLVLLHV